MSDARAEADRLRAAWDERGRAASRDFYVASHPGWDDPRRRAEQARIDAAPLLAGLELRLAELHVLEIGCGVGRLAGLIGARVLSYTGVDVAPSMVAEARARHAGRGGLRFLECDGLSLPAAALDRRYGLVFAHAVFIHCPRAVVAAWLGAAWAALAPGGELRFQLRADAADPGGLPAAPTPTAHAQVAAQQAEAIAHPAELGLAGGDDYMGHAFGWDEARAFVSACGPHELTRMSPTHIGVVIRRPA